MSPDLPVVIDICCGAGGFSEGFRQAGFEIVLGVDSWDSALESFQCNHQNAEVLKADILKEYISVPRNSILIGSPPCQEHSIAKQIIERTHDIECVNAFLKLVDEFQPVYWVMENSPELGKYIREPYQTLKACGYGLRQRRRRAFFGTIPYDLRTQGFQPKPALEVIICAMKPFQKIIRSQIYAVLKGEYSYFYTSKIKVTKANLSNLSEVWARALKEGDVIESRISLVPDKDDEVILNRETVLESEPYKDTEITNFVTQALMNGKGITWLGDGRIPFENDCRLNKGGSYTERNCSNETGMYGNGNDNNWFPQDGRFPANVLVSNDILNDGTISTSNGHFNSKVRMVGHTLYEGGFKDFEQEDKTLTDSGSFSRYFSLNAWWEQKLKELPKEIQKTFPFMIISKASKSERNKGVEDIEVEIGHNRFDTCQICGGTIIQNPDRPSACKCENPVREHNKVKGNFHPTTKPIALMSYLITLGSQEGDMVLDPFCGSGTTLIAAKALNRQGIGIDSDEDYLRLIAVPKLREISKQKKLFSFVEV